MKGYIYKLTSPHTDVIYIGSTIQKLSHRLKGHRHACKNQNLTSKIMFEYGDVSIHLIRECDCDNLLIEEQIEMDKYTGKLCNKIRSYRNLEIKSNQNKKYETSDERREYKKKYRQSDKYKQWSKHYAYWNNGRGQRTLSILKPLFSDI